MSASLHTPSLCLFLHLGQLVQVRLLLLLQSLQHVLDHQHELVELEGRTEEHFMN